MQRLSRIIGVAALVVTATAGPAMAKGHHSDQPVPIKGTVTGIHMILERAPDCDAPEDAVHWWRFTSEGTGQMSHLGRVDYLLTQCTFILPESPPVSLGTTAFTAANRDTLVIAQTTQSQLIGEMDPDPDAFIGQGSWYVDDTVVGGTGRFANATGLGTLNFYGDIPFDDLVYFDDLADGLARFHFEGEIEYRASDRSGK